MSIESIFILLLIAAAAASWAYQSRLSLKAASVARDYIERQELQFLDQSVVLTKIRFGWTKPFGVHLVRTYQFEFTHRGDHRYTGSLQMRGQRIEAIDLPAIVETASQDSSSHQIH
jgi:Protein of unknown function (DUF3301)